MERRTASAFAGAGALLDRSFRDQLRLSWRLLRDERVSAVKFALPALLVLYVMSPIDLIPTSSWGWVRSMTWESPSPGSCSSRGSSPNWRPGMSSTNICGTWVRAARGQSDVPRQKMF
jgi:hypothetical protein